MESTYFHGFQICISRFCPRLMHKFIHVGVFRVNDHREFFNKTLHDDKSTIQNKKKRNGRIFEISIFYETPSYGSLHISFLLLCRDAFSFGRFSFLLTAHLNRTFHHPLHLFPRRLSRSVLETVISPIVQLFEDDGCPRESTLALSGRFVTVLRCSFEP